MVERACARASAQDHQGDRRYADQHQEQQHGPAAERVVPDPVTQREQVVDLPRELLSRRDRLVSGHHGGLPPQRSRSPTTMTRPSPAALPGIALPAPQRPAEMRATYDR